MRNDDRGTQTLAIAALIIACVSPFVSVLIGGVLLLKANGERVADSALLCFASTARCAMEGMEVVGARFATQKGIRA
jgi:hypothetical protein